MRLVREFIGFTRGQDPRDAMNTGLQKSIEEWLYDMNIHKYILSEDEEMFITVQTSVDLTEKILKKLPDFIKFDAIHGGFYCSNNNLTSLKGMPQFISGGFICNDNLLTNLEFGPKNVEGHYIVNNNKLISLKGLPEKINTLAINDNLLTSLKGLPKVINGDLFCYNNNLKKLDFLPEKITGSLFISYTTEFKNKYDINDRVGHKYIEEIQDVCMVVENIKII
jgi:hypothetical protein